jgi:hypothetical protein
MNSTKQNSLRGSPVTQRTFLKTGAILTAGIATLSPAAWAQTNKIQPREVANQ